MNKRKWVYVGLPLLLFVAVSTLRQRLPMPVPELKGGILAWSDDGSRLACASIGGKTRVWDFAANKVIREADFGGSFPEGIGLSPDGKTLAVSGQDVGSAVDIWDVASGRKIVALARGGLGARGLIFSPDGSQLCVSKAVDLQREARVSLYDAKRGFRLIRHLPFTKAEYSLGFNGQRVLASGSSGVECFDLKSNKMLPVPRAGFGSLYAAALSDDGETAAAGGQFGSAVVWEVATGQVICQIASPGGGDFKALWLSNNGSTLWTSGTNGVLEWKVDPSTKTPKDTLSQEASSSEGTWIVAPRRASGLAFSTFDKVTVKR